MKRDWVGLVLLFLVILLMSLLIGLYIMFLELPDTKKPKDTVFEISDGASVTIKNGVVKGKIILHHKIAPPTVAEISQIWLALDVEDKGNVEFKGKVDNMDNVFKLAFLVAKNMRWKVKSVMFDVKPMSTAEFIKAHDLSEILMKCL
jgi:hypothetical protein